MKENMNNLQDFMTVAYDALNIFPNRPIVMIDTPTLFTYGSIGITAIILAVATIYDEEPETESDLANNNSTETPSETNESSPESSYASQLVSPSPTPSPENTESVGGKKIGKNGKSKRDKNKKKRTKRNRN